MSSRVTSLQDYHDCLKSIKAKNVPSIAARMARTLMLLPYRTTERKYEESGVEIDKTGSVFDTLWSESIGSHVPTTAGIMMQDAKRVFELLEKLSSHVIKYERYYQSSFTSIISSPEVKDFLSENFKMRGTGTSQGGVAITKEYYNEVAAIENRCSTLSGLTYVELGYYLNQKTLSDPANSREYDIHSFLRDVADMNVYAWSFVVLNRKNYGGYGNSMYSVTSTLFAYIDKLMPLVEKAINLILEMEHKIDDIAPILNSDAHAISESSTVENRDPINAANVVGFDPAASGWPHPNSIQPTSWNNAFYIPKKSTYRLSFKLESPYLLESLKINGEEIDPILIAGTGTDSESGATYITDNISLEQGDVVSYLIRVSDSTTTLDTSKVHVYIYDTSTRTGEVGLIESLLDYPLQIDQNTLGIFINENLQAATLVLNSNVELVDDNAAPAKYNDSSIPVDSEDNPMYDQRYLYHYRVNPLGIYEDKSKPIVLTFKTKVSPESILSYQVDSSWSDVNAARQVDPDGSIASAEFPPSEGWIDITDVFEEALTDTGWDGTGEFASVVTSIDVSEIEGLDISGCFQIGMLSARPIGQYALLDSQCIIPGGGLKSDSTEAVFNKASFVVTHPTTQVDIIKSDSIEIDRFKICVLSVSGAVSDTLAPTTIQKSTLDMSLLRGSRVYIRKERDLAVHLLVAPYKTIWPNNPDDTLLELPFVATTSQDAIEFKCLDGSIASTLGIPTIDVRNGDIVIFPRKNLPGSIYDRGNVRFRLLKRTLDSEPFWEEVAILYQTEGSSYTGNDNETPFLYQDITYRSVLKRIDRSSNLEPYDVDAVSLIPTPLCNAKRSTYPGCTDVIEFDDDYKVVVDSVKSNSSSGIFSSPGQINWSRGELTVVTSINNMRQFTEVYDVSRALKQSLYKVRSREFMTNTRLQIQSTGTIKHTDDWTGKQVRSFRFRYMTYYTVRLPKSGLYYVECLATVSGDSSNLIPRTLSTYKGSTSDYMLAAPQIYFTTDPRAETMEFASKTDWYRMKDALANGYADEVNSNGDTIRYYSATDPSWAEFNKNWLIPHKQRCARIFDFSKSPREEDNGAPITGILIYPATIEYSTDATTDWYYKWKFILTEIDQLAEMAHG